MESEIGIIYGLFIHLYIQCGIWNPCIPNDTSHKSGRVYMLPVVGSSYGVVVVGLSGVVVVMSTKENRGYRNVCKYVSVKRGSSKIHENPWCWD